MRVALAGGGTGGHLMPGIALAQAIEKEGRGSRVLFLASDREGDVRTLRRYGFQSVHFTARPFNTNPLAWPGFCAESAKVFHKAWRVLADFAPDAAVGLGGYVSFFPLLAARAQRVPILLLEQNVIPGKATRRLSPLAREVACQWQETVRYFGVKVKARVTGNPVRAEVLAGSRDSAAAQLHLDPAKKTMLVIGGSQGAHALNEMMARSAASVARAVPGLQAIHLAGQQDRDEVAAAYAAAGMKAEVAAFLDDMHLAYSAADFALSRAGGTTIAELTARGLPAILVPYPYAADNHQLHNARSLADAGGAVVLEQKDFNEQLLAGLIAKFIDDQVLVRRMHLSSLAQGRPGAVETILATLRSLVPARASGAAIESLSPEPVGKEQL